MGKVWAIQAPNNHPFGTFGHPGPLHLALALVPWAFRRGTRRHVVRLWASFGPTPMAEDLATERRG